ncbi:hypothetical protein GCM10023259_015900 [Thermocatellispora tengchongensis]
MIPEPRPVRVVICTIDGSTVRITWLYACSIARAPAGGVTGGPCCPVPGAGEPGEVAGEAVAVVAGGAGDAGVGEEPPGVPRAPHAPAVVARTAAATRAAPARRG